MPTEDPAGKRQMAVLTSLSSTTKPVVVRGSARGSLLRQADGCFSCNCHMVSASKDEGLSSEEISLTAAQILPSSSLEATMSTKFSERQ